jgi:ubiquitin thioesterase protein OTUB1
MADDSSGNVEEILRNEHLLTQAQLEAIEHEIKSTQPLTSHLLPITALAQQYDTADITPNINYDEQRGFVRSASFLCGKYSSLRKVRGDGNCYYRAFLYAICERLLSIRLNRQNDDDDDYAEFRRLKRTVVESLKWICRHGYDEYTIDMFHEELVDLFDFIEGASSETARAVPSVDAMEQLHSKLNEENAVSICYEMIDRRTFISCANCNNHLTQIFGPQLVSFLLYNITQTSDYCTWFMRLMVAAQMKSNPDRYLPYIMVENYTDVHLFCSREVEPMGKECGMVQVSALAECFGVRVVIEYMDGRMAPGEDKLIHHIFGGEVEDESDTKKEERTSITLLYRPGHYDILY